MPRHLTLVTEDLPSEVLAHRILAHVDAEAVFAQRLGRRGIGYIESKLPSLNRAAAGLKIVVIADRDSRQKCPPEIIRTWVGGPRHPNLVIRMAEMEIESWVMADNESLARFLDVPLNRIPLTPDSIDNPKQILVNIARLSRSRRIRDELCPAVGSSSIVGPAYNSALEKFLRTDWRMARALQNSPSLRRAERRIRELVQR
jgi:hypothetical protein